MSSSMDSDVGNAVGGAALGGLALGMMMQQSSPSPEWTVYVRKLQAQVATLTADLAKANFATQSRDKLLGRSDETIGKLNTDLQRMQTALNQANQNLQAKSAELSQRDAKLSQTQQELSKNREVLEANTKKVETLNRLVDLLIDKRSEMERSLTRQSANTFVITKLYNRLVEEIAHVSNPDNFAALDPEYLLNVVQEEWEEYEETGQMVYRPRIPRLAEAQQEQAFGGPNAQPEIEDITMSILSASSTRP
jgi:septal ring factor EnvC (AmiA/AmiB activator)